MVEFQMVVSLETEVIQLSMKEQMLTEYAKESLGILIKVFFLQI